MFKKILLAATAVLGIAAPALASAHEPYPTTAGYVQPIVQPYVQPRATFTVLRPDHREPVWRWRQARRWERMRRFHQQHNHYGYRR